MNALRVGVGAASRGAGGMLGRRSPAPSESRRLSSVLAGLQATAAVIGESAEDERCAIFLRQLDPEWPPS